jgi:lysophospholipase L1-like esterase
MALLHSWQRWTAALTGVGIAVAGLVRGESPAITSTQPPSLTISVTAGDVMLPDGKSVHTAGGRLVLDGPDLKTFQAAGDKAGDLPASPANYAPFFDSWSPWPLQPRPLALGLSPRYDEMGTLILGGLFRSFREETVRVSSEDGAKNYQRDVDFKFNAEWGQIANLDGHLTGRIRAQGEAALPRLDLVEVGPDGQVKVKKGQTALVCPLLPSPDPDAVGLAGIYIAPWRARNNPFYDGRSVPAGTSEYAITEHEIVPIQPGDEAVAPIHPERVARTLAKLRSGQPVKIAFMGASITVGAEATRWWAPDSYGPKGLTFRGRLIYGLRKRFPQAQIQVIEAFQGGTTVDYALQQLNQKVLPQKPDLVLVDFGANDMAGPVGGAPNKTVPAYQQGMTSLVHQIRAAGAEVLIILPEAVNPWLENHQFQRQPEYAKAATAVADQEGAAVADFCAAFVGQQARGIPFWSQFHNWINHPGNLGHEIYANLLLRFFPAEPAAGGAATGASGPPAAIAAPLGAPSSPGDIVFGITPPSLPAGAWAPAPQKLPPLQDIVAQPAPDRPVYGLYCWADEYVRYHDFIRQVGWSSVRLGGPTSDAAIKLCADDDIQVMACLADCPQPALGAGIETGNRSKFPTDDAFIAAYQRMLRRWVMRWGPGGAFFRENPTVPNRPVRHIEIWNEPDFFYLDLPAYVAPKDDAERRAWDEKRQKLYARLLPAAYQAIKAQSPEISVVGFAAGGASHADTGFINAVLADNPSVASSYDILSTHPYTNSGPPEEDKIESFGRFSMADSLAEIRAAMGKYGAANRPVWYTELNWQITPGEGGRYPVGASLFERHQHFSQVIQAAYLVRGYAWALRLGVKRLDYMSIVDTDKCNSGMLNQDGTWRISAHAIQTMIATMPRPALRGAISDGEDSTYIYRFAPDYLDAAKPDVVMAWCPTGPKMVEIPWPNPQVTVVDMVGARRDFPVANGKLRIQVAPCPLYLAPIAAL